VAIAKQEPLGTKPTVLIALWLETLTGDQQAPFSPEIANQHYLTDNPEERLILMITLWGSSAKDVKRFKRYKAFRSSAPDMPAIAARLLKVTVYVFCCAYAADAWPPPSQRALKITERMNKSKRPVDDVLVHRCLQLLALLRASLLKD